MKTNVIMNRKMGSYEVHQRTKDGMFNATTLLSQWSKSNKKRKDVNDFLKTKSTKEFIEEIDSREDSINRQLSVLTTRGKNAATWMHPLLFIDFAMWINPKFKYDVLKFVYDQLIKERHDAGDNYKVLSSAGTKLRGYNYSEVAKALQWIVFNRTEKQIRQKATEQQLKELNDVQKQLAFAIDMGYITSYKKLISELKQIWRKKYLKPQISA